MSSSLSLRFLATLLLAAAAWSQATGRIEGVVTDPADAVVAGVVEARAVQLEIVL